MATLTMRPFQGEADLNTIAYLINSCDAVDKLEEGTSVTELWEELNTPSVDQNRDMRLWEDSDGRLIGFGYLWITEPSEKIDGYLSSYIHPSFRSHDLETQILEWASERMCQVSQECGVPVNLRSRARDYQTERRAFLENHGFKCDRYFFTMERNLSETIAKPIFPEGFTLHQMHEEDAEAWIEMFNQSFIDHWNHHDITLENLKHWLKQSTYRRDLDLVATAADGTFAAFCYSEINLEENVRNKRNEGYIELLGVRRGFRRLGLGRAILLSGLHQLKAAGVDTVRLGVDADNPNGALQLYESVGFRKIWTKLSYVKDI
jgi:mycothiol synthase